MLDSTSTTLGAGFFLVSFWKPVLLLVLFIPWAMVISKIYDKHAARFHLARRQWNVFHLGMGLLAVLVYFLLPLPSDFAFIASFFAAGAIFAASLITYAYVANKDERVPEKYHIRLNMAKMSEETKADKAKAKLQATVKLAIKQPDEKGKYSILVTPPVAETPEFEVRVAAENILLKAVEARASQIDIAPAKDPQQYAVSHLIDGVRQQAEVLPAPAALKVMDFWKLAARLDVNDRRKKLSARVMTEQETIRRLLHVSSIGVAGGMRLTMVIDPEGAVNKKLSDLGLLDSQLSELQKMVEEEKGTVLLGAPPDAGRTTTLYTILKAHDAYVRNVQTVELEPQLQLEGVRANVFEPEKEGAEYSTLVRSVLRRDPDVVGVADFSDANTAKEIAKADQDRTRTYLSMRTDSSLAAIQTWIKAVGDPKQAAEPLHGVVSNKLIRRLCPNCRVAYPPPGDMLKKLGIPDGKVQQLFKKGGQVLIKNKPEVCPVCKGVGYQGQIGIFEVFSIGPEERQFIASGNLNGLRAQFRKKGLPTIQQVAIKYAIDGVTSVEEVMRVTADGTAAATAGGAAPTGTASKAESASASA
ncbi:MAG: ATPase, T2SS/T4P/T4SS family [Phycisphaerales bacterium]